MGSITHESSFMKARILQRIKVACTHLRAIEVSLEEEDIQVIISESDTQHFWKPSDEAYDGWMELRLVSARFEAVQRSA